MRRNIYTDIASRESVEKIISMRLGHQEAEQKIKQLETSNQIAKWEEQLRSQGLNPSDPTWMRVLTQLVNEWLGDSPFGVFKNLYKR